MAATTVAALFATAAATSASGATTVGATGSGGASASPQRVGSAPRIPAGAVKTGGAAGSTTVQLSVGLEPRDPQALKSFIAATSTKGNPQYHHYLAKGQFAATFGPTQATIAAVTASLKAQGLNPGTVSADGLSIPMTTTLAAAAHAFGTSFSSYKLKDGTTGYANSAAPQIAGNVAGYVSGVTGLESLTHRQSMHTGLRTTGAKAGGSSTATTTRRTAVASGPQICAGATSALSTLTGSPSDGSGYYSAGNLANTYGMEHTATSGSGVTIGVFEMENFSNSDLASYQSCYGTHVSVSRFKTDGGPTEPVYPATNNGIESLLDIEDIASLAPGATIIDYQGTDLDKTTDTTWLHNYQAMVLDDRASVLSISYGGCELYTANAVLNAENYYSMEAAAQGQTILASSGDDGATGCYRAGGTQQFAASVSDPASQPYVTGVGGTSLSGSPATSRSAWSGTGGGTSNVWSLNNSFFNYQTGFTAPGFNSAACQAQTGYTCRQTPDVAADADPNSGYPLAIGGGWGIVGGTSGATPTWASMIAIANTQTACKANGPLGFINFALYSAASPTTYSADYTDITSGTNIAQAGVGYQTGTGYDLPTGLGEPKAATLSNSLCASLPAAAKGAGTFHPVSPTRVLDTRSKNGSPVPFGGITGVQITGNNGIPSTGVTAVVLNVTVTGTTGGGHLTVWGDSTPRPTTSNLNWDRAGQTISNLVTIPVPGDGGVDFFTNSATHVIADVQGYYTNDTSGATFTSQAPTRILDTRSALGTPNKGPVNYNTISLKVDGANGVPSNATAVVMNLTAAFTASNAGYLEAYPEGTTAPTVSNVNWSSTGALLSGLAIVPVGADGNVSIKVNGKSDVVGDVFGYFTADTSGAKFTAAGPARILDTRSSGALAGGHTLALQVTGANGIPSGIKSVVLNITVTGTTSAGFLEAWADGTTRPAAASNVNWVTGQTIPNQVIVPVGADGKVDLYVNSNTQVIADVFGYFN
ncbi:protease pro-enzyme activation domain-containing protein [Streptacidiphilus sp. MAP12-16]|uniref:S53 family peptidase n=1 Tax=Streptacidiphilus sp. MAP12-16 TaxID=3156300 RepID=UPI003510FE12